MVKGRLQQLSGRAVAQRVLAHVLDTLLRLLHPMVPFLTEEVWQRLADAAPRRGIDEVLPAAKSIMQAAWPERDPRRENPVIEAQFARFQQVLRAVRDIRAQAKRAAQGADQVLRPLRRCYGRPTYSDVAVLRRDGQRQAVRLRTGHGRPAGSAQRDACRHGRLRGPGRVDRRAGRNGRKKQEVEKLSGFIAAKEKKLSNRSFVDRRAGGGGSKGRDSLKDLQSQLDAAKEVLEGLANVER